MPRKLRVIHVVRTLATGGLETLVLDVCVRMRAGGAAAQVCALLPGDGLEQRPAYADVPCTVLAERYRDGKLASVHGLTRLFRRERPHVVHTHNFLCQVRAGIAARRAGVPVLVCTKHGNSRSRLIRSRRLAAYAYRLADRVIAVSHDVRSRFLDDLPVPRDRVKVILNGIDTERFRPREGAADAERLGIAGAPLLGTVCRLVHMKGISTLLEALSLVRRDLPEAALVVVGDGPARGDLESLAESLGLEDSVRFLGNRDDVDAIYPQLDVYVQPTYAEGISLTMLEACSCAVPVVATRVGGNPEIVDDGRTGLLVPPRDAQVLAEAIKRTVQDPQAAAERGRAARERIVEDFSLDRMVADHMDLYRRLLTARSDRTAGPIGRLRRIPWLRRSCKAAFLAACLGALVFAILYRWPRVNVPVYYVTARPAFVWFGGLLPFLALGLVGVGRRWFLLGCVLWLAALTASEEVVPLLRPGGQAKRDRFWAARLAHLSRAEQGAADAWKTVPLRVVSWNIHGGRGDTVAMFEQLATVDPDIVFVQEVSGIPLKKRLREVPHFDDYYVVVGRVALVSRFPVTTVLAEGWPKWSRSVYKIKMGEGAEITCINVHLSPLAIRKQLLRGWSWQGLQGAILRTKGELRDLEILLQRHLGDGPLILAGDFNLPPRYPDLRFVVRGLQDCFAVAGHGWGKTAPARLPAMRVDMVHTSPDVTVHYARAVPTRLSDHYMTLAEIEVPLSSPPAPTPERP